MAIDVIKLRNAFGQFATGVTVITANPEGFEPFGMTVNSFASLSMDPPLVLWSLQNDSECSEAFSESDKYAVNILGEHQQDVSGQFAKKNAHALPEDQYQLGSSGCAILKDSIASFECAIEERYEGGDHTILVGRVLEFDFKEGRHPLVFFSGKYQSIN